MTAEELITRLKAWLVVIGEGAMAARLDGFLVIIDKPNFEELLKWQREHKGE